MLGFDDYAAIGDARSRARRAGTRLARAAWTGARCSRSPRSSGRGAGCRGRASVELPAADASRRAPGGSLRRAARGCCAAGSRADPLRRSSSRPGCDRRCAFCAIPSFRGVVRLASPGRGARRGALAGATRACASWSWSARTPRRTARTSATCALLESLLPAARGGRRHRAGAGVLPAAGRDAADADRGDRRHARRGAVLRPVLPARQRAAAAPDAALRRDRAVPRAARARSARIAPTPASAPT